MAPLSGPRLARHARLHDFFRAVLADTGAYSQLRPIFVESEPHHGSCVTLVGMHTHSCSRVSRNAPLQPISMHGRRMSQDTVAARLCHKPRSPCPHTAHRCRKVVQVASWTHMLEAAMCICLCLAVDACVLPLVSCLSCRRGVGCSSVCLTCSCCVASMCPLPLAQPPWRRNCGQAAP
jgi:hypothetical protein